MKGRLATNSNAPVIDAGDTEHFDPRCRTYSQNAMIRRLLAMKLPVCRDNAVRLGIVSAALLAIVALAPLASATDWPSKSYTVSGRAHVRIDTNDGSVRVTTSDSKNVEFHVDYDGYELDKNLHIESHQNGD